ncbi:MAG: hypothetical protein ACRDLL_09335 [Solirubrobacterales bacterium]
MKTRTLGIAAVVSIVGLLAGMAAIAGARDLATTRVSIEAEQGGFFGYLHSPKHNPCELNRSVKLYKQKGDHHDRSVDQLIGSDLAQPNGPDSQWNVNTDKSGKFYAFTKGTSSCKSDYSPTVHSQ